jgi:hypothetical protein
LRIESTPLIFDLRKLSGGVTLRAAPLTGNTMHQQTVTQQISHQQIGRRIIAVRRS